MTALMSELVLQIGIILFAVRLGGRLVKKIRIPPVLGELLAGIVIGPYALGALPLPGFPLGVFPLPGGGSMAVSPELYAFATVASIILLFMSGLETDLALFLRYSVAGVVIGFGGVIFSFVLGAASGVFLLHASFLDPRCLFLGILSTATSVGITARILSDQKKMDSPEGVTVLAAAVFDDVLGIIALAVVMGLVAVLSGNAEAGGLNAAGILLIAGKAFGIWLGFTVLGLIFSRQLASFLKLFRHSFDFSVLALGVALILSGVFEKQGLAMIIGAYIAGLSLSRTDIAAIIQERLHGLYEFFVPVFFAVMGMMVDLREIFSPAVLGFSLIYTVAAILAKIIGCGGPALLLGFNRRGALRIGTGMVPRGEVALIIAGIGLASGALDKQLFAVIILMTLVTTLAAPPLLSASLRLKGMGTRKPVKGSDSIQAHWDFNTPEVANLVIDTLLRDLRAEGFFVQTLNDDEGIIQARKDDIILIITREAEALSIESAAADMPFVKTAVYELILNLSEAVQKLKANSDPAAMKKELADMDGLSRKGPLGLIRRDCVILNLKGHTKEEVITEMVNLLDRREKLTNREQALGDVLSREKMMSTGMQHGIALPHGKTDGVAEICAAVGISREGVDFDSIDGEKSKIFIMVLSPRMSSGPHVQFLANVSSVLKDEEIREKLVAADTQDEVVLLFHHS
ncbi:MAG: cation:proton antiporter [Treponema sp.]|jgi:fructose-specific phosphotransferase system IIA component|nr:cation:proton antiporter [Treponema sp.]